MRVARIFSHILKCRVRNIVPRQPVKRNVAAAGSGTNSSMIPTIKIIRPERSRHGLSVILIIGVNIAKRSKKITRSIDSSDSSAISGAGWQIV